MAIPAVVGAALAFAELAPTIYKWFGQDSNNKEDGTIEKKNSNKEEIATKVINIARAVSGVLDPNSALNKITSNPELIMKFQKEVQIADREMEKIRLYDRMHARERDMAIIKSGRQNTRADIMVIAAVVGLIGCLVALGAYSNNLPGEAVGIISTIAGIFGACLKDAYSFEFGSTREDVDQKRSLKTAIDKLVK